MSNVVLFRPRMQTRVVGIMKNELGGYRVVVIPPMYRHDRAEGHFHTHEAAVDLTVAIARETGWIPFDYTTPDGCRAELEEMAHGRREAL